MLARLPHDGVDLPVREVAVLALDLLGERYAARAVGGDAAVEHCDADARNPVTFMAALNESSTAGDDITLITSGDDDMARILNMRQTNDGTKNTDTIFFDGGLGLGLKGIASPAHLVLLQRYIADKPGDHMFPAELAIINTYLAPATPTIDPATVKAAVAAAIKSTGTTATAAAIAAAVDAALKDDFAAIPRAVRSAIVK